ncbi:MAG: SpoIID/LytB domain-containing protein [Bacteroidetes bacterium]|nr:SpoIID/LytB domain-containing protein [Bacteroidota bacterium]
MRCKWLPGLILFCSLMAFQAKGQMLRVHIAPADKLESFTYQALGDEVVVMTADSFPRKVTVLHTLEKVDVTVGADGIMLAQGSKKFGPFESLHFWCNDEKPRFKLFLDKAAIAFRTYPDHLRIETGPRYLELVNEVFVETYIKGVIHAEAGHHKSLDFFKVQALSARTYALRNIGRHSNHGYDLCDNTHCQAYKGEYLNSPLIDQAVAETAGEVIVFEDNQLIEAVFSANCGGFTANSEDVWVANVNYLRAMPDYNFCEGFDNHAWHITIPKLDFLAKMGRYLNIEAVSFDIIPDISGRVKRVLVNGESKYVISGEELRRLFKLKSSKFHVFDSQSLLFIEGSGFGHGVGMCQDGAYYLSETGMDYHRILKHYYQGVDILNIDKVKNLW